MRIGIFTSSYPGVNGSGGGIPVYTRSLVGGLAALGHEVHVLLHGDPSLGSTLAADGAQLHIFDPTPARVISRWLRGARECIETSRAARRLCAAHNLDLFEFPNFDGMGAAFHWPRRSGPRMVVRLHTSSAECLVIEGRRAAAADRFEIWRESYQCRHADALYVSTEAHRRHMVEELGVPPERIGIVPLGLPDFADPTYRAPRPRHTEPTVVYVGRMEPRKGTIDLLSAVPAILSAVPEARFILIGSDRPNAPGGIPHADWLRANLPPAAQARIRLTGFVDDAERERLLAEADVFAAPSLYESFGLIFVEAMRVAVPVVGTTAGGIPEVVDDGVTGLLVPPKDPARLANAIVRLLKDEPLRLAMAAAGRQRFVERFSSTAMAQRTIAHHEALLGRPG